MRFIRKLGGRIRPIRPRFAAVRGAFRWIAFLIVIGMNAITIYACQRVIDFSEMSQFFFGGVAGLANDNGALVLVLGVLLLKWSLLYFLYRHRIFLRV